MPPFRGVEFSRIDSLFADEDLAVPQTGREFVENREGPFPSESTPEIAEPGFLRANLEGDGCAGMGNIGYGLICQELERGQSGVRSLVSVQGELVTYPILTFGSEQQERHWLSRLQSGRAIGRCGLREPDFGFDPAGMGATAGQDGREGIPACRYRIQVLSCLLTR